MAVTERLAPHNMEAERAVLGAILLDADLYHQAAALIRAGDFYLGSHRKVFSAFTALEAERGAGAIDLITLREVLARQGVSLEEVGGNAYISSLIDGLPRYSNIEHYARIVRDKALLRRLIRAAAQIEGECYAEDSGAREIYGKALEKILTLEKEDADSRLVWMDDFEGGPALFDDMLRRYNEAMEGKVETNEFIPLPWPPLDKYHLLERRKVGIVAGLTTVGKTMLLCNIAMQAAAAGYGVVFFSKEDGGRELRRRLLAAYAGVPYMDLRWRMTKETWEAVQPKIDEMLKWRLAINNDIALTMEQVTAMAWRAKRERGVDLVIVDYVQKFIQERALDDVNRAMSTLVVLADRLNASVIIGSQLNRRGGERDQRTGKPVRPSMRDLKESSTLEQFADWVVILNRWSYFDAEKKEGLGETELYIEKNKGGRTGMVKLDFDGETQQVREIEAGEAEECTSESE